MAEPERPHKDLSDVDLLILQKRTRSRFLNTSQHDLTYPEVLKAYLAVNEERDIRDLTGLNGAQREQAVLQMAQGLFGHYLFKESDEEAAQKAIRTARVFFAEWDAQMAKR